MLPAAVLNHSGKDAATLRVLLWLAGDLSLAKKPAQLAKLADCDTKAVREALDYWKAEGILTDEGRPVAPVAPTEAAVPTVAIPEPSPKAEAPVRKLVKRADELPTYSSAELTALLDKRDSVRVLIDEAQNILGKMFNLSEINIMVGMIDYLGLDEECILLLLEHCKRIGKLNLRAIEKYAYPLIERGITSAELLEEEIREVEARRSFEGQVRAMFGMKSRALTSREDKMLRAWISFGYGAEIVRRAYELTVQATGEASLPYANSILERWHAEGLSDADAIDAAIAADAEKKAAQKAAKNAPKTAAGELGNSFDTDDYFEAALQRSFRATGVEDTGNKP